MALPPDTAESFAREVDENLRRDQAAETAKRYGGLVAAVVILFLLAVGGYLFWKDRRDKQAATQTEQLSGILQDASEGKTAGAPIKLDALATADAPAVAAAAGFTRAALALQQNDRKRALDTYAALAANTDLPAAFRDLAKVRQSEIDFDTVGPDAIIARLQPLVEPGLPYFGSAGEMLGMALIAKGQKPAAAQLFAKIAADKGVPDSLRARAVQVAGSLGIDASASLPTGTATAE